MPGKVMVEIPQSFKIQDYLNAFSHESGLNFLLTNPEDKMRIFKKRLNIAVIGISFQSPQNELPLGFQLGEQRETDTPESDKTEYEAEAILALDVDPNSLPQGLEGTTWVVQVIDFAKMESFTPIATALSEKFGVNVIMTPATQEDPDPKHEDVERSKSGGLVCPITIRKVSPAE